MHKLWIFSIAILMVPASQALIPSNPWLETSEGIVPSEYHLFPGGEGDAGSGRDAPAHRADPNPLWIASGVLYSGAAHSVVINPAYGLDSDTYAFKLDSAQRLTFWVEGTFGCPTVIDATGNQVEAVCTDPANGPGWGSAAIAAGTYFLQIVDMGATRYTFSIGLDAPPAPPLSTDNDAGSGFDAPDVATPMITLASAQAYDASSGKALTDNDFYALPVDAGDVLSLAVASVGPSCVWLESVEGESIHWWCASSGEAPGALTVPSAGEWYLRVNGFPADSPYRFSVGVNEAPAALV